MDSPFEVLEIDPDADDAEIVRAYRRRVKEAHPDQGGSASEFQRVRTAYEKLRAGYRNLDPDQSPDDAEDEEEAESSREGSRVEFLNYEVLDDHGWGLGDDDLFEKASEAGLDPVDYGQILVKPGESLLEAAENRGFAWPYACRGGACANCAVAVVEGDMETPGHHILSEDMRAHGIRLSCNGKPTTDEMKVLYNVKHLPGLDELRLPPDRFERARP